MLSKHLSKLVLGGAAFAGIAGSANAALVIDVVATGGGTVSPDGKTVVSTPGGVVTFNVFANATGNNGSTADDGILSLAGSFLSNGALHGNLAATRAATMTGTGSSNGLAVDLDADADLDVGSNNNASSANFFSARSSVAPTPVFGPSVLIGTLTFTLTDLGASTVVNFRPRNASTAGSWFEDGSQITSANFTAGSGVTVLVPEPTTLGLAAIGGLSLLARRRNA